MDAVLECCAGLDVHQETVVACVLLGPLEHKPKKEIRMFSTTTPDLLKLADWLEEQKCSHVAMESTGIYWKPVWNILETGTFQLILGPMPNESRMFLDEKRMSKMRNGLPNSFEVV